MISRSSLIRSATCATCQPPAQSAHRQCSYDIHSRMLFHKNSRKADAYCDDAEHDLPCNILKAFAIPQGKHSGKRADTTAVQRQITFVQRDGSPFLRDPKRPEVIEGPASIVSARIGGAAPRLRLDEILLHGRLLLRYRQGLFRERQAIYRVVLSVRVRRKA